MASLSSVYFVTFTISPISPRAAALYLTLLDIDLNISFDMLRKLCGWHARRRRVYVKREAAYWRCDHENFHGRLEYYVTCRDKRRRKKKLRKTTTRRHVVLGSDLLADCQCVGRLSGTGDNARLDKANK